MSLGQKTLAIVFLTVASLMAGLYVAARVLLLRSFLELEREETYEAVDRAQSALNDNIADLAATANDYAAWDRAYFFMEHPKPENIRGEFENGALQGLGINSVLLIDTTGREVFSKSYDFIAKRQTDFPLATRAVLISDPWVRRVQSAPSPRSGILGLPEGPALIVACPILTSERKGPSRGVLVMTRNLDEHLVAGLKGLTLSSLTIGAIPAPGRARESEFPERRMGGDQAAVRVEPLNRDLVAGYSTLRDVHGRPILRLEVDVRRDVFQRGISSLRYVLGALCLGSLAFGLSTWLLLHYSILGRLSGLSAQVAEIGQRKSLSDRVWIRGADEIGQLAVAINSMLRALQQSDTQFRHIAENIHQLFWVREVHSPRFSYLSPALEKVWGFSSEGMDATPATWPETVHPDDRAVVDEMLKNQERGLHGEAEFRLLKRDGNARWVWNRYFPVFDDAGKVIQIVGLAEDITDSKKAEEVLLRSQEELEGLVHERTSELAESVRLASLGARIGSVLTQASELGDGLRQCATAFVEYLDAAEAQFWTLKPAGTVPELQVRAGDCGPLDGSVSPLPGRYEVERIAQSGEPIFSNDARRDLHADTCRWVAHQGMASFAGHPLMVEGQMVGVVAMFARLSLTPAAVECVVTAAGQIAQFIKRVRTRDALHASEEHFRQMFATIPVPIWLYDATSLKFLEVNDAALRHYGYSREEFLGMTVEDLNPAQTPEEAQVEIQNNLQIAANETLPTVPRKHRTKDGRLLDVEIHCQRVKFTGTSAILVAARDITEHNRMEVELRHGQKLQAVGSLAAGIAHEINTPIQFVADNVLFFSESFAELEPLFEKYSELYAAARTGPVPRELVEEVAAAEQKTELSYVRREIPAALKQTLDGVNRVTTIVQALKTFSHVDSDQKKAAADLNAALESTIIVARNELRYVADVETAFGELPPVICHVGDLNQVFLNLLVNAAHAITDVVKNSGKRGRIRVETRTEDDSAVVSISDTGAGIPEAIRMRIFEPFFTTKGVGKGTGQGLALARSIVVEKHGGSLTFESEVGKGTTFYIRIPMTKASALVETASAQ